ncbi:MAG: DNA polymerase III subunit beta [Thiobacillaceae bacterium]
MLLMETDRNSLLLPLGSTIGVVERRHTLPILSNVLLEKKGADLVLQATDLELQVSTKLTGAATEGEFAITVAARKLFDIVRALPDDAKVKLESKDTQVEVKAGRSKFTLQTLPAADFPRMETSAASAAEVRVPQKLLRKLLQLVQFSMAQQDIRYYLNGMLLVLEGKILRVVATDGHRLALAETSLERDVGKRELIVPRKTVLELVKLLADSDDPVSLYLGESQVMFRLGDTQLVSKVVDGKFPDYQRVVPLGHDKKMTINRHAGISALQRAAILSNEKFRGVRLVLGTNSLRVVCNNNEQEEAQEEMEAKYDSDPIDIGFNVSYLLDGLGSLSSDEVVLAFNDPNSSVLLTCESEPGFKYVVMPMRI